MREGCVFVGGGHVLLGGGVTFCEEVCHSGRRHDLIEECVSFTEVNLPESRCVLVGASISIREKASHCGWGCVLEGGVCPFKIGVS